MLIWLLPVLGGLVFLFVLGRYNARAALEDWEALLGRGQLERLKALEEHVALDAYLADRAHSKALRARERARREDVQRMMKLAARVIEEAVPDRVARLRGMAVCSRMVAALVPLPPLMPRDFKLPQLMTLVGASGLLHHLLVTVEERFRLRLWVMSWGYMLVRNVASGSAGAGDGDGKAALADLEPALEDFKVLDREHVEAFRALLLSLTERKRLTA